MSDIEYDPSGNSNLSFHVTAEIYSCYMTFFHVFPFIVNTKIW